MGLDRLILALGEVAAPSDDLPTECDLGEAVREFFERPEVQARMVEMNQSQLFDLQEDTKGHRLGVYKDKTAKHKRKIGLPDHYYTYYETGKTYESLRVYVDATSVSIWPDHETAPEYAQALKGSAWGLNPENRSECVPEIKDIAINKIREYLNG